MLRSAWLAAAIGIVWMVCTLTAAEDSGRLRRQFAQPPRQYSSAPLWVWNDMLTEEQVVSSLRDLAAQQVKQVFVHPRPGLMTPYLSEDWFRLWKVALKEAERLDMNLWIYDENSYPSGFAGGLVPEAMPESRGRGLSVREAKRPPKPDQNLVAVFARSGDRYRNVTEAVRAGKSLPPGSYLVATERLAPSRGWFGGKFYVDLLRPGVTEKFLEITLEAYRRHIGEQFGKRVPGVFTDEPHLAPAGGLHWSQNLPELFKKRWGYDLIDSLPSLVRPVGDWQRVRHNYYQLLLEQFIEHWSRPYHDWCQQHGLQWTGHYWEHGWPEAGHGGDNMAMYAWHQRPAIDILMNQYREDVHAQFGNVRSVLELASVANQMGRARTLCETYGAGGWDLRLEDMKRIGDWVYVLGVNTLDEHLSYITIRGARKRDHPQSFSYHEPWWQAYHVMAQYFTRLSLVLSAGQQINRVLLVEPTTTAWMYQGDRHLNELGERFQRLVTELAKRQVEFDIGCEDIMARHGKVEGAAFVVGQRRYQVVVLPPSVENLNGPTMKLLEQYASAGGTVLRCGPPPARVDGAPSARGSALARLAAVREVAPEKLADRLLQLTADDGFSVRQAPDDKGILYHHRRQLGDGQVLFLVNTSIEAPCSGTLQAKAGGIEQWNPQTGRISAYRFQRTDDAISARFRLPPCGSLLLFLSKAERQPAPSRKRTRTELKPAGEMQIRRTESNVLTLDYVDVTAGGETKRNLYFFPAARFVFQKHGLDGNPWERAVQFRDELIRHAFPPDSGFKATYRFTIKERVPDELFAVVERPDLYRITCNGKPVAAEPGQWWLDRAFGKIDIAAAAQVGQNALTITARPMTMYHELEPAYLLGNFALEPSDAGFVIVPDRPLKLGAWNEQGHPFYAAGLAYRQEFEIDQPQGRYLVWLGKWYGSVAKVMVNGRLAGYIACRPCRCDVTRLIKPGRNWVEVIVIGTLKNTLGPHHAGKIVGAAWPNMFQKGPASGPPPGQQYHTLGYGLFEPFRVRCVK